MANTIKTYEEFTGGKEMTPAKIKAYAEYVKAETAKLPSPQPLQTSDVWPSPKKQD